MREDRTNSQRAESPATTQPKRLFVRIAGPVFAALLWLALPGEERGLPPAGAATLALMGWMAVWWMTEAIPLWLTALLPLVFLPMSGAGTFVEALQPYFAPLIFLFLGGFLLARGMSARGLDRRFALLVLSRVGTRPSHMIGGMMLATATLSAFVSNTATAAMMLPIALGLLALVEGEDREGSMTGLRIAMLLAIAYSASIGGLATLVGSPPNGFLAQFRADTFGEPISFVRWMLYGVPLVIVLLPTVWWLLTRKLFALPREELHGGVTLIASERARLGAMSTGERRLFAVFVLAVVLWVGGPWLPKWTRPFGDAGVAMGAGILLLVLPKTSWLGERVLPLKHAVIQPWGVLVLFGGGLSLAKAVERTGVANFLGDAASAFAGCPTIVLTIIVTTGVIFLTELTSNIATTATLVPLLAAAAPGLGVPSESLTLPAALAASCAFMLPVATPPNAIVFGSGQIRIGQMMRAGWWLNWIGILVVSVWVWLLGDVLGWIG